MSLRRRKNKKVVSEVDVILRDARTARRNWRWADGYGRRAFSLTFDEAIEIVSALSTLIRIGYVLGPQLDEYMGIIRRLSPVNADCLQRTLDARKAERQQPPAPEAV